MTYTIENLENGNDNGHAPAKMQFPSAQQYYEENGGAPRFGKSTEVLPPADPEKFTFGSQPAAYKNAHAPDKNHPITIGVIGGGNVYNNFLGDALDHLGIPHKISDLDLTKIPVDKQAKGINDFAGMDFVIIGTPPAHRYSYATELQSHEPAIPFMMEKPFMANAAAMAKLLEYLNKDAPAPAPIYAIDWEVSLATPLLAACHYAKGGEKSQVPFTDIVQMDEASKKAFANFDMTNLKKVDARYIESIENPKCDPKEFFGKRGTWLSNIDQGGGSLYDLMVHPMNTLAVLGLIPGEIQKNGTILGYPDVQRDADKKVTGIKNPGTFLRIGNVGTRAKSTKAEWYARVKVHSKYHGEGEDVPMTFETAKFGKKNDQFIALEDQNGNVLRWEMGRPDKSIVTMTDHTGEVVATASSRVDPYTLMILENIKFLDTEKKRKAELGDKYVPSALYVKEHAAVLKALGRVHKLVRAQPLLNKSELIVQQSEEARPAPVADLGTPGTELNPPEQKQQARV